jgi:hypothetical protein
MALSLADKNATLSIKLYQVPYMVSVIFKAFMLNVFMLNVIMLSFSLL